MASKEGKYVKMVHKHRNKEKNVYFKSISETFANFSQHLPLADEQFSTFYASIGILNPK